MLMNVSLDNALKSEKKETIQFQEKSAAKMQRSAV